MTRYIVKSTATRYAGNDKIYKFDNYDTAVEFADKRQKTNKKAVCVFEIKSSETKPAYNGGTYTKYKATKIYDAKTKATVKENNCEITEFN